MILGYFSVEQTQKALVGGWVKKKKLMLFSTQSKRGVEHGKHEKNKSAEKNTKEIMERTNQLKKIQIKT